MPVPTQLETPKNRVYTVLSFHIDLVDITGNMDVITQITPGFVGSIVKVYWIQGTPAATINRLTTLNWEIGAADIAGGAVALTTATCTPMGKVIESTAITGSSTFDRDDTLSLKSTGTTAFAEGDGYLVTIIAMDITR